MKPYASVLVSSLQFGEVIATTGHEEAIVMADVDLAEIAIRRYGGQYSLINIWHPAWHAVGAMTSS